MPRDADRQHDGTIEHGTGILEQLAIGPHASGLTGVLDPYTPLTEHRQVWRIVMPPSTGMIAPFRKLAAGRHRLTVICATSSGSP